MLVAGLVVLIIAVLFLLAGLVGGSGPVSLDLGAMTLSTNAKTVFVLGMVTLALAVVGLWMMRIGLRHVRAHRRDRRKVTELSQRLEEAGRPGAQERATTEQSEEPTRTD